MNEKINAMFEVCGAAAALVSTSGLIDSDTASADLDKMLALCDALSALRKYPSSHPIPPPSINLCPPGADERPGHPGDAAYWHGLAVNALADATAEMVALYGDLDLQRAKNQRGEYLRQIKVANDAIANAQQWLGALETTRKETDAK